MLGCQVKPNDRLLISYDMLDIPTALFYLRFFLKKKHFCAMCQAASSSWLAEAREVRSLTSKVKDLEAKLGPIEAHIKNKDSEENVEISNISNALDEAHINKDSQERMGASKLVNASSEAESLS
jgi:hypothetical protein